MRASAGATACAALVCAWPFAGSAGYPEALTAIARGSLGEAYEACIEAAEAGDPDCENAVGWLALQRPEFGGPDAARAWFQRAAGRGHPPAMKNLAFLWGRGLGGPVDVEQAAALYRAAQASGIRARPSPKAPAPETARVAVPEARLAEARFRSGYADLLMLRTLHALRQDRADGYVHTAELEAAEEAAGTLLADLANQLLDLGDNPADLRAAVEKEQAIVLRLLDRHADRFDPAVRDRAEQILGRLLGSRPR